MIMFLAGAPLQIRPYVSSPDVARTNDLKLAVKIGPLPAIFGLRIVTQQVKFHAQDDGTVDSCVMEVAATGASLVKRLLA